MPATRTLDPAAVRADFPILSEPVGGQPLVYLDNAASAQKPERVIRAVDHYYRHQHANVHRGIHELGRRATEAYEDARARVAAFIGADPDEVVWTRGTTEAINLVAGAWGIDSLDEGDEILLTTMEHHSNIVPWQLVAARTGARLRYLEMDDEECLRLDMLDEVLTDRTRLLAVTHVSNALGTVNPLAALIEAAHAAGALVLVDGAQAVPHMQIDVHALGADFYALSGHKMFGPTGIGVLWARRELLEEMPPYHGGGEMIRVVRRESSTWADVPHKFEAGTPNIAGAVGLAAACDYLTEIGMDAVQAYEHEVVRYAYECLSAMEGVRVYGPRDPANRAGVVAFTMDEAHPHDISTVLDSRGIAIRAGHHCAQLVMEHCGVAATARASFAFYNTREEVDRLVQAVEAVRRIFA
ncbi:MAG: cysteine desulfurase [Gemmatimonadetes bacterium]|nr:MAG: cysteine desulfurase [Gemmatimonadota bacterium]